MIEVKIERPWRAVSMDDPSRLTRLIGVAGSIGSGKTTITQQIAALGDGTALTISDTLKRQATNLGIGHDRRSLQNLLRKAVDLSPDSLVRDIVGSRNQGLIIVDGVRQISVWCALYRYLQPAKACLVFVSVPWSE